MKQITSTSRHDSKMKEKQGQQHHLGHDQYSIHEGHDLDHVRLPFAYKLHLLLSDMETKGSEHIISWVDNGNAFKIHDPQKFEDLIQPHYFRQSKLSSFIRQCYIYGFSKMEHGPAPGSYFHPNFQRDNQAKSLTILRQCQTRSHCHHCNNMNSPPLGKKSSRQMMEKTPEGIKGKPIMETKPHLSPGSTGPNPCAMIASPISSMRSRHTVDVDDDDGTHGEMGNLVIEEYLLLSSSMNVGDRHHVVDPWMIEDPSVFEPRPLEVLIQPCQIQWWSSCALTDNKSPMSVPYSKTYSCSSLFTL